MDEYKNIGINNTDAKDLNFLGLGNNDKKDLKDWFEKQYPENWRKVWQEYKGLGGDKRTLDNSVLQRTVASMGGDSSAPAVSNGMTPEQMMAVMNTSNQDSNNNTNSKSSVPVWVYIVGGVVLVGGVVTGIILAKGNKK